jgi:hypothetical protein
MKAANVRGFGEKQIRNAKVKFGVKAKQTASGWVWCLPQHANRIGKAS